MKPKVEKRSGWYVFPTAREWKFTPYRKAVRRKKTGFFETQKEN